MTENTNLPNYMTDNRTKGIQLKSIKTDPNNPGTFTVSEEEAAKLRAMAMNNNGSELSAEMQAAMGMIDADYDQKIPKNIHNQICYDEARRNTEKYRKEASEFTDSIVEDNATREILDEAEATTNLSKFDFGDIGDYLKKLEDLSFLEAVSYKKKVDVEIARWKSCQSMLKAISEMKLDDTVNREVMKINAMEDFKFMESIDDFERHYDENLNKLNQISNKLISLINAHKHEMDSTRFLTNEMIHLMQGKLDKLDPNGINYEYNKVRMETIIDAFKNRRDLDFLKYKLEMYLKTSKANIKREFRDSAVIINSNRRTKVINDLIRFFNEDIVYAVYERLMYAFNDDVYATYLMMCLLARIMNTEKKTSKDVWGKVFVLNLSDIYNNIFDIDILSDGEDSYMMKVEKAFFPIIKDFLKSQKMTVKLNHGTTFGLKTPAKKKVEDISNEETSNSVARGMSEPIIIAPAEEATVF